MRRAVYLLDGLIEDVSSGWVGAGIAWCIYKVCVLLFWVRKERMIVAICFVFVFSFLVGI